MFYRKLNETEEPTPKPILNILMRGMNGMDTERASIASGIFRI